MPVHLASTVPPLPEIPLDVRLPDPHPEQAQKDLIPPFCRNLLPCPPQRLDLVSEGERSPPDREIPEECRVAFRRGDLLSGAHNNPARSGNVLDPSWLDHRIRGWRTVEGDIRLPGDYGDHHAVVAGDDARRWKVEEPDPVGKRGVGDNDVGRPFGRAGHPLLLPGGDAEEADAAGGLRLSRYLVKERARLRRLPDAGVGAHLIVVVPFDDDAVPSRRCNLVEEAEEEFRLIETRAGASVVGTVAGEDDERRVDLPDQAEERVGIDLLPAGCAPFPRPPREIAEREDPRHGPGLGPGGDRPPGRPKVDVESNQRCGECSARRAPP